MLVMVVVSVLVHVVECCEGTSFCGGGREGGSVPIVMVSVLVMVKVLVSAIAMVGSESGSASNIDGESASASQFLWCW